MVVKCMGFQSDESRAHGVVSFLESVNHPYSSLVYTDYLDYIKTMTNARLRLTRTLTGVS